MSEKGAPLKDRDWGRRAFGPAGRRTIAAFAEAMFSDENETGLVPAPASLTDRVAEEFDLLIGAGSSDLRRGFALLAFFVEWLPVVILGELSRASRLPLARRLAYLHRLFATLFIAFKLPLTMIVFELAPELGATGFDRPTISAQRVRRLAMAEDERSPADAEPGPHSEPAAQDSG
jgi:hypothetical protein